MKISLKKKLLIAMVALALLPLIFNWFIVSSVAGNLVAKHLARIANDQVALVEQSIVRTIQHKVDDLIFLKESRSFSASVASLYEHGSRGQLQQFLDDAGIDYNFDLLEVYDAQGKRLARSVAEDATVADGEGVDHDALKYAIESGDANGDFVHYAGRLGFLAGGAIRTAHGRVALITVKFVDDDFVYDVASQLGSEVALYDRSGYLGVSSEALLAVPPASIQDDPPPTIEAEEALFSLYKLSGEGEAYGVVLAVNKVVEAQTLQDLKATMSVNLLAGGLLAVVIALLLSKSVLRPLLQVIRQLEVISSGQGDLTQQLPVNSQDEVGQLAMSFNRFTGMLREMVGKIHRATENQADVAGNIRQLSSNVSGGAETQNSTIEESHRALLTIEASSADIVDSVGTLINAADESSSATLELGATIEEISGQMESLFGTVESVSSSISEMSVSSRQVSDNVETLELATEVTTGSIVQLDASIKTIEEVAGETSELAAKATEDAERGRSAVAEIIKGINEVKASVDRAGERVVALGARSRDISHMLTVIEEVSEQTSLLALNAKIIAAQAGVHGRGFGVVAEEIRELAERTSVSTREIDMIISELQSGTDEVVTAMQEGVARVHQEVARTEDAERALDQIQNSTEQALQQVEGIVQATREQSKGSRQITGSINQVSTMLGQIGSAVRQQTDGIQQLADAAEGMREIAAHGKVSTAEQAKGSRQISRNIEQVRDMVERISSATTEQNNQTQNAVAAIAKVREVAEGNTAMTGQLDKVVKALADQTEILQTETGAFKIEEG